MSTQERYVVAAHAMQSGVQMEMELGLPDAAVSPKHLRVGVNSALVNAAAIASLLIEKGVFTMDEYLAAMADHMETEKKRYENRLCAATGTDVTLE